MLSPFNLLQFEWDMARCRLGVFILLGLLWESLICGSVLIFNFRKFSATYHFMYLFCSFLFSLEFSQCICHTFCSCPHLLIFCSGLYFYLLSFSEEVFTDPSPALSNVLMSPSKAFFILLQCFYFRHFPFNSFLVSTFLLSLHICSWVQPTFFPLQSLAC